MTAPKCSCYLHSPIPAPLVAAPAQPAAEGESAASANLALACCICDADISDGEPHVADGADAFCWACAHVCVECGAIGPVVATAGLCGACHVLARQRDGSAREPFASAWPRDTFVDLLACPTSTELAAVPVAIVGDESAVSP